MFSSELIHSPKCRELQKQCKWFLTGLCFPQPTVLMISKLLPTFPVPGLLFPKLQIPPSSPSVSLHVSHVLQVGLKVPRCIQVLGALALFHSLFPLLTSGFYCHLQLPHIWNLILVFLSKYYASMILFKILSESIDVSYVFYSLT